MTLAAVSAPAAAIASDLGLPGVPSGKAALKAQRNAVAAAK